MAAKEPVSQGATAVPPPQGAPAGSEWSNSFWSCCSPVDTCFFACCLPCLLFGKVSARIKDPSLANFSYFNPMCLAFYCLPCAAPVLEAIERGKLREKYHIEGSTAMDFVSACCCLCCTLVQMEKESKQRAEADGYQRTEGMNYPS